MTTASTVQIHKLQILIWSSSTDCRNRQRLHAGKRTYKQDNTLTAQVTQCNANRLLLLYIIYYYTLVHHIPLKHQQKVHHYVNLFFSDYTRYFAIICPELNQHKCIRQMYYKYDRNEAHSSATSNFKFYVYQLTVRVFTCTYNTIYRFE
jgi:hypothetical protein